MGTKTVVACIGLSKCQRAKRNSVGTLMCMSFNNEKCLKKEGPLPK